MWMIWFVLDDPNQLTALLEAWETAGIRGATIIESSGLHRRRKHLPMRYVFDSGMVEEGHVTLFAVVPGEEAVEDCLRASESITGDLSEPNTGMFAAWPIGRVKGLPKRSMFESGDLQG